ncbi:MAG: response regulator [Deltaproteobacteria bacterium]|nr:response regulator [Deltaproteobacteria bacterium]
MEKKPIILLVDDEEMVLKALTRTLLDPDWELLTANNGAQALALMAEHQVAAIISDQRMPGMNGLELLGEVKRRYPEVVRMVLTGYAEMNVVVKAINQGEVYRFFTKPWDGEELRRTLKEIVARHNEDQNRIAAVGAQLLRANLDTVMALAEAIELKDHYTKGHCSRVRDYSLQMALALNLSSEFCRDLVYASLLHDCGKIGVSETILNINGPLNEEQFAEVKKHPQLGFEMTSKIDYLRPASIIIRQHHERWDGRGYPDGLRGEEISLGARIVAVADTFDAMTSSRPYRRALDFKAALKELRAVRGSQLDPHLVDLFNSLLTVETVGVATEAAAPRRLLLVGVAPEISRMMVEVLPMNRYRLTRVDTSEQALPLLAHSDMVICALCPVATDDCLGFLAECRRSRPQVIRIMQIENKDMEKITETINQAGLYAYLVSPLRAEEILALIENAFEWRAMAEKLDFDGQVSLTSQERGLK